MRYVALALAVFACAAPAAAKDGVVAHLVNPGALTAPAGTRVVVIWTLRAGAQPFGARGVYVRLRGRTTSTSTALAQELAPGRYRVRVPIPSGGVRSVVIALVGWRSDAAGARRADWRFPIDNDPTR